jgi:hypothetical protein
MKHTVHVQTSRTWTRDKILAVRSQVTKLVTIALTDNDLWHCARHYDVFTQKRVTTSNVWISCTQ